MDHDERRGSLWLALGEPNKRKKILVGKLRGKYLFRAIVRLVIEYKNWIDEKLVVEEPETGTKKKNRFEEKKELSLKDRSILLIDPQHRTRDNRAYIWQLMRNFQILKKYEDNLRESLAPVCRYQYVTAQRVIVRQGHPPEALYYIVSGQVDLSKIEIDNVTGDEIETNVGTLTSGDIFGEISLLHKVPRTMTITSKTPVDLLYIARKDFNEILKFSLMEEWDIFQDALNNFNYFKGWDEKLMRECCILSKVKNYKPNEIIIGDGKGMVNYVHFVLAGECKLIEHMILKEKKFKRETQYSLYNPENHGSKLNENNILKNQKLTENDRKLNQNEWEFERVRSFESVKPISITELTEYLKRKRFPSKDRLSMATVTLLDVINQWHEITETATILMKKPSTISQQQYPKNVRTIFMQICIFYRGSCFALGEEMRNRRIVSLTDVKCLLIPRYWLLKQNRANIWERVKLFLNSKYPNRDELLQKFASQRKWIKYRQSLVEEIIERNGRQIPNDTSRSDVPYSIRINEIY
ncbi:uncharacterized protein LOC122503478 [Leptopilina heterotoma]|uniref:uncharacterized protein LOC122503478 n=1 Tax=Leptopilina heterotoma TaxID=63436 RepID=UPI001CA7FFF3|nr:uncharacterized protein LOC122503478 [Leptopilina heterotoma]